MTLVSIIVPCRQEVDYVDTCMESITRQRCNSISLEIVVADGMSTDGTRAKLSDWQEKDPRIKVIDNPDHFVSAGLNKAIRRSNGTIIVRIDMHTEYDPFYVETCVKVLQSTNAANVGGPWRAKGTGYVQKAISLAFQSPYSSGGAGSHREEYEGEVDSVYLGCWHRETFDRLGLFDEELVRNQDDELNLRLVRAGGRIWQSPSIKSWYYPRSSIIALFKQYAQYGYWKVRVIQKHRLPASIRHVVPGAFVGSLLCLAIVAPFARLAQLLLFLLFGLYVVGNIGASILICAKKTRYRYIPIMPFVLSGFHFGYGYGFLRGVVDFMLLRRRGRQSLATLTRTK